MVMSGKIVMEWEASAFAEDFNLHCATFAAFDLFL